jgi:HEAT repeat protein
VTDPSEPSALLERLASDDRAEQRRACDEAAARVPREPALRDALRERLADPRPHARFAAAFVLFHAERPTLRLLPALLESLELADGDARWQAAQMLAALGRLHGEVLPVLLSEARGARAAMRRRMALYALRELAPERAETAQVFLAALDDADGHVRRAALSCFAKLSDPPRALAERALALARGADPDPRMARIAAVVLPDLVRFHPELRAGVTALLDSLEHADDPSLVRAAVAARQRLAAEPAAIP